MADDDAPDHPAEPQFLPPGELAAYDERLRASDRDLYEASRFWRRVLSDPVGRRELFKILASGHAFEERFACGPTGVPQSEATWFQAGEQSFAFNLYRSWKRMDPVGVLRMELENDPLMRPPPKRRRRKA
jgi:hypothetical protein